MARRETGPYRTCDKLPESYWLDPTAPGQHDQMKKNPLLLTTREDTIVLKQPKTPGSKKSNVNLQTAPYKY